MLSLAGDEQLVALAEASWSAVALLWAGVLNVASRSRYGREAQARWSAAVTDMLAVIGSACAQAESGVAHPRAVAGCLGLFGQSSVRGLGLAVLSQMACSHIAAADLVGDLDRNIGVCASAGSVLARVLYCAVTSGTQAGSQQFSALPSQVSALLGSDGATATNIGLSWSSAPMHWRATLGIALANCNIPHAISLSSAQCRRTVRTVVRESTNIRAIVDGLPQWMAARGAVLDALL